MVGQTINSVVHKDFSVTFTFNIISSKNNLIIIKTLMIQSESTNIYKWFLKYRGLLLSTLRIQYIIIFTVMDNQESFRTFGISQEEFDKERNAEYESYGLHFSKVIVFYSYNEYKTIFLN